MTDIVSRVFSWIGDLFTKLFDMIKKILPYILIALAIWFSLGLGIPALGIAGGWTSAALALGASFVVAPDETGALLSSAASAMGDVLSTVATGVGSAAGDLTSSFATSSGLLTLALFGFGAYLLLSSDDDDPASSQYSVGGATVKRIPDNEINSRSTSNG